MKGVLMEKSKLWVAVLVGIVCVGGILAYLFSQSTIFSAAQGTPVAMNPSLEPTPTLFVPSPTATETFTPMPTFTPSVTPSPKPTLPPALTLTAEPTAVSGTATPTPLPPLRPTPVRIGILPTLNPSQTISVPTAVPLQEIPEGATTILLLGSDQRPDWNDWHTDVIQYAVIYPDAPAVNLLSIPRDLYVYVPGFWMSRINFADMYGDTYHYDGGGIGLLNQTLLYNLGISADYYVKVNFDGLITLVDSMGGIDVPVYCRLEDYWPYMDETTGEYPWFVLNPGIHRLDGEQSLWYARSRKTTNVFSRERRQQQVLEGMWHRARDLNLMEKAPQLYQQTRNLYQTNLGVGNILDLARTAKDLTSADIRRYNIGARQVEYTVTEHGGNVYLPVWPAVQPVIEDALARPADSRAYQAGIKIEVWNGTMNRDYDKLAADTLAHNGFIPVIGKADRRDYPRTQLVYFSAVSKGTGINRIQELFKIAPDRVIQEEVQESEFKIRLIIGADYEPCTQR